MKNENFDIFGFAYVVPSSYVNCSCKMISEVNEETSPSENLQLTYCYRIRPWKDRVSSVNEQVTRIPLA